MMSINALWVWTIPLALAGLILVNLLGLAVLWRTMERDRKRRAKRRAAAPAPPLRAWGEAIDFDRRSRAAARNGDRQQGGKAA